MLSSDIREYIVRPSLQAISLWSESAEILVYGTGMVETGYNYLMQIGTPENGGLGFWQMEKSDYEDIYTYLRHPSNSRLFNTITSAAYYASFPMDPSVLVHNLRFSAIMCRLHYYRIPEALPDAKDAQGMAEYHKIYYNSSLGLSDVSKSTSIFQEAIDEII